mmetsp:Transcript_34441/g.47720  ORF Transcript_34441/g.47720 Transcript_34441/m.47720 type:complete len:235 (+) Transcript_34441:63-767(+)
MIRDNSTSSPVDSNQSKQVRGKGTLAPSKSTIYVANLDYSLTNSDIHTIFSTVGHIVKVSVVKNRDGEWARQSKGLAFIQFNTKEDANKAVETFHGKVLNGRTLKVSVAADNGRAADFIRRREYPDKSRCYECGEEGHLSYDCPKNQLGSRDHPPAKRKKRRHQLDLPTASLHQKEGKRTSLDEFRNNDEDFDEGWASAIVSRTNVQRDSSLIRVGLKGPKTYRGYFSDESISD